MLDALDVGRVNVACRGLGILDRCLACAVEESTTREVGDGLLGEHTHAQLRGRRAASCARRRSRRWWSAPRPRSTRAPSDAARAVDRRQDPRLRQRGLGRRPRRAAGRLPLLRGRGRARAPAPRRAADPDRRGRQRRAADGARAPAAAGKGSEPAGVPLAPARSKRGTARRCGAAPPRRARRRKVRLLRGRAVPGLAAGGGCSKRSSHVVGERLPESGAEETQACHDGRSSRGRRRRRRSRTTTSGPPGLPPVTWPPHSPQNDFGSPFSGRARRAHGCPHRR